MAKIVTCSGLLVFEAVVSTMTVSRNLAEEGVLWAGMLIAAATSLPTVVRLADHLFEQVTGAPGVSDGTE